MKIRFEFEKETKGTFRFKEVSDEPVIGTLYIKKSAVKDLKLTDQDSITVEIKKEDK